MNLNKTTKQRWEHLLASGGYSIGQFSVTVQGDIVRIYHYRTKQVHFFPRELSFEGMEQLCKERGYDLSFLLNNYYPKSIHPVEKLTSERAG